MNNVNEIEFLKEYGNRSTAIRTIERILAAEAI